jgi:IS605 OrfB family transposase
MKNKIFSDENIISYQQNIIKNNSNIWTPSENIKYKNIETDSWFNIKENTNIYSTKCKFEEIINNPVKQVIKSTEVNLILNTEQKTIIDRWMETYRLMYNETVKYIKTIYFETNKLKLSFTHLRTKILKTNRDEFIKSSSINSIDHPTQIKTHILDCAIQLACSNYKSAVANFKNGNIKHFRVRYWRKNRPTKVLAVEPSFFKKNTICKTELGQIKCLYDGKEYKLNNITSTSIIHYNSDTKKYTLRIPTKLDIIDNKKPFNIVSLDPGIRCFMTGLSENEVIKISDTNTDFIKSKLQRIDEIENNVYIPNKIKKKNIKRINKKISNQVDDLHWKSINYLTKKYKNILIGDMSIKGIVKNGKNTYMDKMTKRIAYKLKFFSFHQRLIYKCQLNNCNYKKVDESYTSKMCSKCGTIDYNLGSNKIYKCINDKCKLKIDRDVNGCRGIFLKNML